MYAKHWLFIFSPLILSLFRICIDFRLIRLRSLRLFIFLFVCPPFIYPAQSGFVFIKKIRINSKITRESNQSRKPFKTQWRFGDVVVFSFFFSLVQWTEKAVLFTFQSQIHETWKNIKLYCIWKNNKKQTRMKIDSLVECTRSIWRLWWWCRWR